MLSRIIRRFQLNSVGGLLGGLAVLVGAYLVLGNHNQRVLRSIIRDSERNRGGAFALREAARHSLVDEIERLIESGVDVNSRTEGGVTPLMFAYNAEIGGLLIRHGADVNARNDKGNTPLMCFLHALAEKHVAEKYLRLLVSSGADVSVRSSFDGRSAYSWAEDKYGPDVAKLLQPTTAETKEGAAE